VCDRVPADVTEQERQRAICIARELRVVYVTLRDSELVQWSFSFE
jgi:hypothetical protein